MKKLLPKYANSLIKFKVNGVNLVFDSSKESPTSYAKWSALGLDYIFVEEEKKDTTKVIKYEGVPQKPAKKDKEEDKE